MKTKIISFTGVLLSAGLATNGLAQTNANADNSPDTILLGQAARVSELIGSPIKNYSGQKLGEVKDLAVDMVNGRVVEVIVEPESFWGRSKPLVGVPPESFLVAGNGRVLFCSADKDKLAGAPTLDLSSWNEGMTPSRVEGAYHYFGLAPYFHGQEHSSNNPDSLSPGQVERASQLFGLYALNQRQERAGNVVELVADLPRGRVAEVIVDTGDFLGTAGELSAVPPQTLHFNSNDTFTFEANREAIMKAPHFSRHAWPQFDRAQVIAVDQAYQVEPYFVPVGPDTADNAAVNRGEEASDPMNLAQTPADMAITLKIREDLRTADGLGAVAHNVRIATLNGRVTLRGVVATYDERRRVGEVAARTVSPSQVDNQLEIKEATASVAY